MLCKWMFIQLYTVDCLWYGAICLLRYDQGEFFPGTGHVEDVGAGAAAGSTVNVPWDGPGPGDADYMAAFTRL